MSGTCYLFLVNDGGGILGTSSCSFADGLLELYNFLDKSPYSISDPVGLHIYSEMNSEIIFSFQNPWKSSMAFQRAVKILKGANRSKSSLQKPLMIQIENSFKQFLGSGGKLRVNWSLTIIILQKNVNVPMSLSNFVSDCMKLRNVPIRKVVLISWGEVESFVKDDGGKVEQYQFIVSNQQQLLMTLKGLFLDRLNKAIPVVVNIDGKSIDCELTSSILPGFNELTKVKPSYQFTHFFFRSWFREQEQLLNKKLASGRVNLNVVLKVVSRIPFSNVSPEILYGYPMRLSASEHSNNLDFAVLASSINEMNVALVCNQLQPICETEAVILVMPNCKDQSYLVARRLVTAELLLESHDEIPEELGELTDNGKLEAIPLVNEDVVLSLFSCP